MAAAAQLNNAGHWVTVYERADEIGGLLRYGIPDFKLEKNVVERRVKLMEAEGIKFITSANVGVDVPVQQLRDEFDAIVLCGGSTVPRDLSIPGRELAGVEFAMDFLTQQNKRVSGKAVEAKEIKATGKHVIVIGGGDTGSDCVGTSNRHGAASVTQLEIMSKPPKDKNSATPWPNWPLILRTSTSHEEGCDRNWSILTKKFTGNDKGEVTGLVVVDIEWKNEPGKPAAFTEVAGSERTLPCDLALLAMGFLHPQHQGLLDQLGVEYDERGNVKCTRYQTSSEYIFAAGDMRRGQSLVVWAISEGREAARAVDLYLNGHTELQAKEVGLLSVK
jgi:glutamate synthase (NADPH/NADH) small chain